MEKHLNKQCQLIILAARDLLSSCDKSDKIQRPKFLQYKFELNILEYYDSNMLTK